MRKIYLKNSNWIVRSRRVNSLLSPTNGEKVIMVSLPDISRHHEKPSVCLILSSSEKVCLNLVIIWGTHFLGRREYQPEVESSLHRGGQIPNRIRSEVFCYTSLDRCLSRKLDKMPPIRVWPPLISDTWQDHSITFYCLASCNIVTILVRQHWQLQDFNFDNF